jgi:glucitol/sorbitol PTS system EIIA component
MTYYRSTVVHVGHEAKDMVAGGVIILFAEPVPEALAEVSIVHRPEQLLSGHPISVGDTVSIGGQQVEITAVGDLATKNLEDLGHVVLYINQPDQKLLPGAVHTTGELPLPEPNDVIEFRART